MNEWMSLRFPFPGTDRASLRGHLTLEDEGTTLPWNFGKRLLSDAASSPRR